MLYCSNLRGSTISPSGVPLFHHPCSTVPPSDVTLLHHQMFYCSTNRCSTFPPLDLSLSHHFCFTVPPSAVQDVKVFYHQVFYCFSAPAVGFFTVPPWDVLLFTIRCSTVFVLLLHHQMFYFFTMRCSIVPPLDVSLVHHDCSTVSPSDVLLFTMSVPLFDHQIVYCSNIATYWNTQLEPLRRRENKSPFIAYQTS